jgi:hypothetical protein
MRWRWRKSLTKNNLNYQYLVLYLYLILAEATRRECWVEHVCTCKCAREVLYLVYLCVYVQQYKSGWALTNLPLNLVERRRHIPYFSLPKTAFVYRLLLLCAFTTACSNIFTSQLLVSSSGTLTYFLFFRKEHISFIFEKVGKVLQNKNFHAK